MTLPRRVVPGQTYMISRRCVQRQFLLKPDDETVEIFNYALSEAAAHCGMKVFLWLAMSNHHHVIIHDVLGVVPEFLERFHRTIAVVSNTRLGREENFWASTETSIVHLATPEAVLEKVVYLLSNPVTALLVDRHSDWPGASALSYLDGKRTTHRRPRWYFRKDGKMPKEVELGIEVPPEMSEDWPRWRERIRDALDEKECSVRAARLREGLRIIGRKAILAVSPFDSPNTPRATMSIRPEVATKDRDARSGVLEVLSLFREAYFAARLRFAAGDRQTAFPFGTWKLRRFLGVVCSDEDGQLLAA